VSGFRVYRSLEEVPPAFGPSALTIGNFDGLHAGHRHILQRVVEIARENAWKPGVLTFDPHPTRIVAPARSPRLLTNTEQRCALMREEGIEQVVVLPFTERLAMVPPEEFVTGILVARLEVRAVLVGDNFRFGAGQAGDIATLRALGTRHGFLAEVLSGVKRHGRVVSSSGVRELIRKGDVTLAGRFLERPHFVEGRVVTGFGIGSKQTVPTLNLETDAELLPARGVYITRTHDPDSSRRWNSVTNIGTRPTFDGAEQTIETYLIDPLVGASPQRIRIEFLWHVREERRFESPQALKAQIAADVQRARTYFRRYQRWTVRGHAGLSC
jgi:riboflavin kinase / FMN adenylyltransferase